MKLKETNRNLREANLETEKHKAKLKSEALCPASVIRDPPGRADPPQTSDPAAPPKVIPAPRSL